MSRVTTTTKGAFVVWHVDLESIQALEALDFQLCFAGMWSRDRLETHIGPGLISDR